MTKDQGLERTQEPRLKAQRPIILSSALLAILIILFVNLTYGIESLEARLPGSDEQNSSKEMHSSKKSNTTLKLSIGNDTNANNQADDPKSSYFLQTYFCSSAVTPLSSATNLSIKIQNGIQYLTNPALNNESIMINDLLISTSHKFSELLSPEVALKFKNRLSMTGDANSTPKEEPFVRGSARISIESMPDKDLRTVLFFNTNVTNFGNLDIYDALERQLGIGLQARLLPNTTFALGLSRDLINLYRWKDNQGNRRDSNKEITLSLQSYVGALFDFSYSHMDYRSNRSQYSYKGNRFTLMVAEPLPEQLTFQLYSTLRLEDRASPYESIDSIDTDFSNVRWSTTLKLSYDLSDSLGIEAQYDVRNRRSIEPNKHYTSHVISASIVIQF